ncbi:MAG: RnfABCDGE type electron transport complex subunit D [Clostridia bacterium]|nr:RnfABCDGE type electron transport complex subunit D [Oscillospiraceae bacterium]MBO5358030.1 RnfABCDGE type electron transport complex subunit D [Clostridia bacterium]
MNKILNVSSSPHLRHPDTTQGIMLDVIIALLPAAIFGCVIFGWRAALVLAVCVASCFIFEFLWNIICKKQQSAFDLSAIVTGLLLGMNLPRTIPLWMAVVGSFVAIVIVKQLFGGIGHNFANPAITARIVLMVSFPVAMTSYVEPFAVDAVSSATPLASLYGDATSAVTVKDAFFGIQGGCIGETSAFLLIIGGLYLMLRRVINPVIPVCFVGTVALASLIAGQNVGLCVFSGGLMLGAIFMATDYTTSPTTNLGKAVFGICCGLITFIIRYFGALPEGVSYSILLMNILTPYINRLTTRKPFGFVKAKEGK